MVWKCSKCGTENEDSEEFCGSCGAKREEPGPGVGKPPEKPPEKGHGEMPPPPVPPEPHNKITIKIIDCPEKSLIDTEHTYDLDAFSVVTLGRDPSNVLFLPDPYVSREHGKIYVEDNRIYYEDLGSSNGSYIYKDGKFEKVEGKVEIGNNTTLRLGMYTSVLIKY